MGSDDEHIKAMRWLYEDEKSYRKAAAKLKLEELKARKEKELIRQYRKRQRRIWVHKAETALRPLVLKLKKQKVSRRQLALGGAALGVGGLIWGGYIAVSHNKSSNQTKTLGATTVTADFSPAIPKDGSQNVTTTENNHHKIITYQNTLGDARLIVSQQKLPDNFKSDAQAITRLDQFRTATPLDTPKGKLYITANPTGQQWAAITYQDVLIFFQANKRISLDDWYKYIKDLQIQ